jgi:glyoxylate reductase
MPPSILLTRDLPASVLPRLAAVGTVEVLGPGLGSSPDTLASRLAGKDALICTLTDRVDARVIAGASRLRIIANVAVGYDNIDVASAATRGIVVTNTPDVLTGSVADFTWALILAVTRRLSEGERVVRSGRWEGWAFDYMLGTELRGRQLGVIGLGRIGRAVAERAQAFGMRVAYVARGGPGLPGAEPMTVDRLLETSDVVSLHVPLTPETRHLVDRRALARMKPTAFLINTSRGPVVDEEALAWALETRLIAGAALDVYEREPAVCAGLLRLENVLLAPHLGSGTLETRTAMAALAADNVVAVLSGLAPLTPVA